MDRWPEDGGLVTGNFFHVLGAGAARGRTLTPSDDEPGGFHVLVLSHRAWSRSFASDPGVVGRMVQVNEVPFEVVGVMPEGFRGLTVAPPDFWAPLVLLGEFHRNNEGRDHSVGIVGRLKPGVSRPGARGAPRVGLASDRLFFILTARACASGNSTRLRRDGA